MDTTGCASLFRPCGHWYAARVQKFQLPMIAVLVAALAGSSGVAGQGAAGVSSFDQAAGNVARRARETPPRHARNVILFIGDGMSIATITAARILEGQQQGRGGEENRLAFEEFPATALVRTYSANQQTSDSAPTATAMLTGWRVNDRALSVAPEVAHDSSATAVAPYVLPTLLERAEERGLATGVVTTTRITHATPAASYAHTPDRDWEHAGQMPQGATLPDIAAQLVLRQQTGNGIEVVLGGGREALLPVGATDPEYADRRGRRPDGRNLVSEWLAAQPGSAFVWNRDQLLAAGKRGGPLLGLFDPSHMHYEADRGGDAGGEPSLAEMTRVAIARLQEKPKGYFLLVEGGRIDHAHHAGNAYRALTDTIAFSDAVRAAVQAVNERDTLILVTADHSHTMTIAGYPARGNPILGLVQGPGASGPQRDAQGQPYATLSYANGPGFGMVEGNIDRSPAHAVSPGRSQDLARIDTAAPGFHQQALVPMRAETHGGEDVALFARGPGSELVRGSIDQNEIFHVMRQALGL